MPKVMTVAGTRPELIKLSRVIAELDRCTRHAFVHTGQNFDHELNRIFFGDLGLREPDHALECAGPTPAATVANVLARVDELLERERPDAFLVLGDTNSALSAYCAKRRRIPVFHMEAGNRCFDERVPEEVNRRIVDHASDVNLVYSEHARRNLLREGFAPDRIIKTGSPMREVLDHNHDRIAASGILRELGLSPRGYFLVSAHREDNVDAPEDLARLAAALRALAAAHPIPIVFGVHPRTRKRIAEHGIELPASVKALKPFAFTDYIALQRGARCVLSDSGTLTEEAALLEFPAVMLRRAHERPEGTDRGTVILAGLEPDDVLAAVATMVDQFWERGIRTAPVEDYDNAQVAVQVCRTILGYRGFVERTVWRKP